MVMESIWTPEIPGKAFEEFLAKNLGVAKAQKYWEPGDSALPALYLSHGAPPVFDDREWMDDFFRWAQSFPKPRAILIVSAHWESAPLALSTPHGNAGLVYDFGGFADIYYTMRYDTPDAFDLAAKITSLMPESEPVHQSNSRGLDHGAWVPLKVMYPLGDVPVIQMSMPTHDPEKLLALGERLKPLREEGVLIIGSGFMVHGLRHATHEMLFFNKIPAWSQEFDAWADEALRSGNIDELAKYKSVAPGMPYAHPTVEHFTPLFVALGAASTPDAPFKTAISGYRFGFSRRSIEVA
jgi:4,5-DOPA dioxygenase extradiol